MKIKNLIALSILTITITFTACQTSDENVITEEDVVIEEVVITDENCIIGEGSIVTKTIALSALSGVDSNMSANVVIEQGEIQKVTATGHPNIINKLNTDIVNGIWDIKLEDACYKNFELSIHIIVSNLHTIEVNSSGNIEVKDFTNQSSTINVTSKNSGNITFNSNEGTKELNVTLESSGDFIGKNDFTSLEKITLMIKSHGSYDACAISAKHVDIKSAGSGKVKTTATETLNATITGSGSIKYNGTPLVTKNITGSGSLLTTSCSSSVDEDTTDDTTTSCIEGEGTTVTQEIILDTFTGIDSNLSVNVIVEQGDIQKVTATGHANIINKLKTDVIGSIWSIKLEDGCHKNFELSIHITVPNLNTITINSSGDIEVKDFTNQSNISIDSQSSGDITFNSNEGTEELNIVLESSGGFIAKNDFASLKKITLTISGSGSYDGFLITTDEAVVNTRSSGDAKLSVKNLLDVKVNSSGSVFYKGNPTITEQDSGSGSLVDAN